MSANNIMAALDMDGVKVALVIGVTGHRDIREEDREPLKNSVRDVFTGLRTQYPSTPLVLLSPLAEGADRLVAEVALLPEIGARLIAPLPMRKDLYETDFEDPNSLVEFHRLLGRADQSFEIPLIADEAAVGHPGPERNLQYEAVGKYIARESQILIALWDGVTSNQVGGTSAIVTFQTEGLPERHACHLFPPELFPAYHILTPRVSNPHPEGNLPPFQLSVIYPSAFGSEGQAEKHYERAFRYLDEFNRLAAKGGAALEKKVEKSKAWVIDGFDERNFSRIETWTLNRYAVADALAIQFQEKVVLAHRALHWLAFLSFSSFVFYAHLPHHPALALALALVFLALGSAVYKMARYMAVDEKRQDYRAMAEGCRVSFFWALAGVRDSVADNYLGKQETELDWIRSGSRGWEIGLVHNPAPVWADPKERLQFVLKHWVAHQCRYFAGEVKKSEGKSGLLERFVTVWLILAVGIRIGLLVANTMIPLPRGGESSEPIWMVVAIIATDLLLGAAALVHHANERMAHSEHLKRNRRSLKIFKNADESIRRLLESDKVAVARTCVRALGREALIENGDWVRLLRERPLEIPL